jgi:hypothetical protein
LHCKLITTKNVYFYFLSFYLKGGFFLQIITHDWLPQLRHLVRRGERARAREKERKREREKERKGQLELELELELES